MRILYVITTLHRGGAEAHLLQLAKGLQSRGETCQVAFLRSKVDGGSVDLRGAFEEAGVRTHNLDCERPYDVRAGMRLHRVLSQAPCDVLHSHLPRADSAGLVCKLLNPGQTWISTLHHPYDNAYSGAPLIPFLAPMWRRADGIIAVSDPVREWAIRRLGAHVNRVRTIVHGIAENPTLGNDEREPGQRRCIGSIGRYEPRKNHETLIRAMVHVLKEFPDAQLRIAGPDPWGYGEQLRRLIADLHLDHHVQLVGFISDKSAFFSGIDIFAFASHSEGFGIVVLEAMEAGKPSVVSDIPPLNDIISPGHSGIAARPNDPESFAEAIRELFRDPTRLRAMGAEARRRVATDFSESAMIDETRGYYRDVLARGRESY
jgi:glycosyltransferase involved in cell wall biosynthesis